MADRLGKYELLHVLGKGAMGTVYEGFDPIIARRLAIKTVRLPDPDDIEAQEELARFKREAQAAGRLSHPNIVGVFDYGETPEIAYIVMEFVDGTTLKHVVDKKERFELAEVVRLMEGVLSGLQFSHDRGVVHRDIKPANIMLTKAGEVKIADFGIARIESSSMTQAGTMLGTPSYMSPEQFMGQTVDARTDLYSCGVMLYQLLTGDKPFEGGLTAIMHKVLNTEPPPPSALSVTVPHAFDLVVQRAMAKRPEDRFPNANEFIRALKEAVENKSAASSLSFGAHEFGDGDATMVSPSRTSSGNTIPPNRVQAAPAPLPAAAPPKKGPPIALIGGGAVAVLAVIAGAGYFLLGGHSHPNTPTTPPPAQTAITQPQAQPATPPPAPQAAPMTAAQRESTLTATLASLPCTLLSGDDSGAQPAISGLSGAGAPQASLNAATGSLPQAISPSSTVQTIDGPYCDALNAIRPYHNLFAAAGTTLGLNLAGGKTTLHDGDLITVTNTMPNYSGYLETDYFSSDGTVLHLYPTPTDAQKLQAASSAKTLGDPTKGGASWQVSAPYGTDMIIAIATSTPLFTSPRAQDENASDYLPALRAALQNVASSGGSVAVAAIPVVTLPK
jgi:serine/threonine protein kinase